MPNEPPIPLPAPPRRFALIDLTSRLHGTYTCEADLYAYACEHDIAKFGIVDLLCTYCGMTAITANGVRAHGAECPERTHS